MIQKIKSKFREIFEGKIVRLFCPKCKVKDDDLIFASYEKSGRTWVRFFVAEYINLTYNFGYDISWENFTKLTPSPLCNKRDGLLSFPKGMIPRPIFSHNAVVIPFIPHRKVVFISRNFFDIIVSKYFFMMHRNKKSLSKIDINTFIAKKFNYSKAFKKINSFSKAINKSSDYLIVSYEDLKKDPKKNFRRIIKFSDYPYNEKLIDEAIKNASFDSMHKKEVKEKKYKNKEAFHTRKGNVSGYHDYLTDDSIIFLKSKISNGLKGVLKNYFLGDEK